MGKFQTILGALDALAPEAQRLAQRAAWSPRMGCGCLFGTLIPGYPRGGWSCVNFEDAFTPAAERHVALGPAARWFAELGLTRLEVRALQEFNDACVEGEQAADSVERFRLVRAFVEKLARREAGGGL